jgi:outer membrane receptor protein involved in Fe transport
VSASPRVTAAYMVTATTRVHVSAGAGIRAPDVHEYAWMNDNPGLQPERTRSVDVGGHQVFHGDAVLLEATAFFTTYDDLIVTLGTSLAGASQYRVDNIANARARGMEVSGAVRPGRHIHLRGAYTFLDTEMLAIDRTDGLAPFPYAVGDALIRRPRHHGSLSATYTARRLTAFAEALLRGKVPDVEPHFGALGGTFTASRFAVVDVGATVRVGKGLETFARVENAGDRVYEEALGFPAPGATALFGIRFALSR